MRRSKVGTLIIIGGLLSIGGCWPDSSDGQNVSDDSTVSYHRGGEATGGGTTGIGGPDSYTLNICDVLGPHSSLVLLRMQENPEFHEMAPGCDPSDDPFATMYFDMDVEIVEQVSGPTVPSPVNLKFFYSEYHPEPELASGPMMLAALRESEGEWFLDTFLYADPAGASANVTPRDPSDDLGLPAKWGELKQKAQSTASDYDAICGTDRNGYAPTYFFHDDQEYADYRYVRDSPKPDCATHDTTNATTGSGDTNARTNDDRG